MHSRKHPVAAGCFFEIHSLPMTPEVFVASTSFRFFGPSFAVPQLWLYWLYRSPALMGWMERWNTRLPVPLHPALRSLLCIPRMSTLAMGTLLRECVAQMPAGSAYVNIGVWHGFSILAGMAGNADRRCIGVDNFSEFGGPRDAFLARFKCRASPHHSFYEMDYRDYFSSVHRGPIGCYFYDGSHTYEDQLEGLQAAEPFFVAGTLVLIDDTNWEAPRNAMEEFLRTSLRRYERILDIRTARNNHPTWWNGLIVLRSF